jgi:hypothetical protein
MSADKRRDVPHYTTGGIEFIDVAKAKMTSEQFEGFCLGNVIKYLFRYQHKGTPVADLQKAQTYLGWLRETVEGKPEQTYQVHVLYTEKEES